MEQFIQSVSSREFLRSLFIDNQEQEELKSTVDTSVKKLKYKTTLYDKTREQTTRRSLMVKSWEPKRARQ